MPYHIYLFHPSIPFVFLVDGVPERSKWGCSCWCVGFCTWGYWEAAAIETSYYKQTAGGVSNNQSTQVRYRDSISVFYLYYLPSQHCFSGLLSLSHLLVVCFRIHRAAMWILGEYCTSTEDIQNVMTLIRQSIGDVSCFSIPFPAQSLCIRKSHLNDLQNILWKI